MCKLQHWTIGVIKAEDLNNTIVPPNQDIGYPIARQITSRQTRYAYMQTQGERLASRNPRRPTSVGITSILLLIKHIPAVDWLLSLEFHHSHFAVLGPIQHLFAILTCTGGGHTT